MHNGFGIFALGILTLEDWSYYPRRKQWKGNHALITLVDFAKDAY